MPVPDSARLTQQERALADTGFGPDALAALRASAEAERAIAARVAALSRTQREQVETAIAATDAASAERIRLDALSERELRGELAAALLDCQDTRQHVEQAEASLARAQQRVTATEAQLRALADLDARIADWRLEQVKQNRDEPLPAELLHARATRGSVMEQADATRATFAALREELRAAELNATDAECRRDAAAANVIARYADRLADELAALQAEITERRIRLASMTTVWLPQAAGSTGPFPVSQLVRDVLRWRPRDQPPDAAVKAALHRWFIALQSDADAQLADASA